jgi:hypothetical protein
MRVLSFSAMRVLSFMYTLFEDAIERQGSRVEASGVYARTSWYGMSKELVEEYHTAAYQQSIKLKREAWFPERLLAELDPHSLRWMTEYPTPQEYGHYRANPLYIRHLVDTLGDTEGETLERLAHYLVSMIPGSRVYRRKRTGSDSDYDVVGSFEGPGLDFRSELGRYFLCECKDWQGPADVTVIAKTAYFLDSVKVRFGILFSRSGISGQTKNTHAEYEQLNVYARLGIAIAVIDNTDLERLANGDNFLSILRTKYEKLRLDITDDKPQLANGKKPPQRSAAKPRTKAKDSNSSKRSKSRR